ncbi:MAG: alpha/beta hydrolase [Rhodocyclaceae bacterium]|nr:alpha/beta hydrolase [Rhodocyclaceae bacterium]MBX3669729.1 alpha/beta hydrolase [Rhodocyclaceae bacterium]
MLRLVATIFLCTLLLAAPNVHAAEKACALIALHGKWASPRDISFFANRLAPSCDYKALEMPWAKRREYDAPYPAALQDIRQQVAAFRADVYKRIVLAGHSFGANAAIAYMAEFGDADAIVALAPGHSPRFMYERGIGREAVDEARERVAAGKGAETVTMLDLNSGDRKLNIRMRADVLLSYFDPQGLGNMQLTAPRIMKPVPILWVVGDQDPLSRLGPQYAFQRAPHHPASKYVSVNADHANTPDAAVAEVLAWIQALPE